MRGPSLFFIGLLLAASPAVNVLAQGAVDEPPTVTIVDPAPDAAINGTYTVRGTATDAEDALMLVEVRFDAGAWRGAAGTENWTYAWDTTTVTDASHTIEARAYDGSAYSDIDSVDVTVANDVEPPDVPTNDTPTNLPPIVTMLAPAAASVVAGTVSVRGAASDPDGDVQRVDVRIDQGAWQAANGTSNWTFAWNTTTVADGNRTIEARAYDGTLYSNTASRAVSVRNEDVTSEESPVGEIAPLVTLDAPADGDTVNGTITLSGTASVDEEINVTKVELRVDDGPWLRATGTLAWTYRLDTTGLEDGEHTVSVRALAGEAASDVVTIALNVANGEGAGVGAGNQPPVVLIEEPEPGALVNGTLQLRGTASDPDEGDAVMRVEVSVPGGGWRAATGDTHWNYTWQARGTAPGDYVLQVRAVDRHNGTGRASLPVTVQSLNSRPTFTLDIPRADDEVGQLLVLEGKASDPDGDPLRLDVKVGGQGWMSFLVVSDETFRVVVHTDTLPPGPQTLVARVHDGQAASQEARVPLLRAEAQSGLSAGSSWVLIVGGILLLFALVGVVVMLLTRRKAGAA